MIEDLLAAEPGASQIALMDRVGGAAMQSIFATNKTALVTGASSGIGLEITRALAPKLDSLIIVARRLERLQEMAADLQSRFPQLNVAAEAIDLSVPEAIDGLLRQFEARHVDIDILVNNAGLGESELFERSPWSRINQIVQVNILAMLRVSHQLLPAMIGRGHGAILNIGSGAGYAAMPNAAVYTASKHFVRAFTESLRAQLAGTGIVVSEAAPGPVDTEFDQVAGIEEGGATPGRGIFGISAEDCAREIVQEFEKGSPVIFPGRNYRWMMKAQPLVPRRLITRQVVEAARKMRR
jgi:short-subunit dehydrogenase